MSLDIKKFGKFKLLKQIARGGMAEIFLACTGSIEGAHKFVVIKRISLMHSKSREFNKMFQNEGKIAINLSHSNIGSIYEFGVEQDQYFICMEYVSGRNLRQLTQKLKRQKKQLSVKFCAHIIKYVCQGLDYAHNCTDNITGQPLNIVHRDISPQNIMVSFSGDVKVIDFGIAKIDDSEATKAGVLKGKFEYMSPEQARGKNIDKQTDIFSLGNVLWELLARRKLFTGNNEIQLLKKIRDCQIPDLKQINPHVPDKLVAIVNKALNANKNLRYKTVADMGNDISLFLNKHYPDFTSSHFTSFIKEVYIEEIMEERENLKTWSKILKKSGITSAQIKDSTVTETFASQFKGYDKDLERKTQLAEDSSASYSALDATVSVVDQDFEEGSEYTETETRPSMASHKKEITKTKFDDPLDSGDVPTTLTDSYTITNENGTKSIITTSHEGKSSLQYNPWHAPEKKQSLNDRQKALIRNKRKRKLVQKVFILSCVLGIPFSSWFFFQEIKGQVLSLTQKLHYIVKKDNKKLSLSQLNLPNKKTAEEKAGPKPVAPSHKRELTNVSSSTKRDVQPAFPTTPVEKNVFLVTRPSGAYVYINGVRNSNTTPTFVSIPVDQPTQMLIKKQGYHDKSVTLSPKKLEKKIQYSLTRKAERKRHEIIIIR